MPGIIYQGDNLPILRDMDSGSVDLIYLDPPFNTGRQREDGSNSYSDSWPSMDAYLDFMRERLVELHRLLREDGSIYLHCDWRVSHHLRLMLDEVFGEDNFLNEIAWCYSPTGPLSRNFWSRKHDTILFYSKSPGQNTWIRQYTELTDNDLKRFRHVDSDGRKYKIVRGHCQYLDEHKGRQVASWWVDIPSRGTATKSKEWVGYPSQKPIALLRRIIEASSNAGDVVLDPFCGSGVAVAVAEVLGRVGVGIERNDDVVPICNEIMRVAADRWRLTWPAEVISS